MQRKFGNLWAVTTGCILGGRIWQMRRTFFARRRLRSFRNGRGRDRCDSPQDLSQWSARWLAKAVKIGLQGLLTPATNGVKEVVAVVAGVAVVESPIPVRMFSGHQ